MKKIFTIGVFILGMLSFSFSVSYAAPKCDGNRAPDLQMEDPACYTSKTVTSRTWGVTGQTFHSTCRWDLYCRNCSYPCGSRACRANFYKGYGSGCKINHWCSNSGSPPRYGYYTNDYGWISTQSTDYTCYYKVVNEWGTCNTDTGMQFASSISQRSRSGTNCQNYDQRTSRSCAACGIASNTPTGVQPTEDLCIPLNTASTPTLNTTTNMWEWTCTADDGSVNCDTPNSVHGVCNSVYTGVALDNLPADTNALCETGTVANIRDNGDQGWQWDCMHIGTLYTNDDLNCHAPCFDYTIKPENTNFYWDNNDEAEVTVNLTKTGRCANQYSCTITIDDEDSVNGVETFTHTIDATNSTGAYNVSAVCNYTGPDPDVDPEVEKDPEVVRGACIVRSCTPQGTCQSGPQSAANSGSCTSTCSSNADCTTGRMIETQP